MFGIFVSVPVQMYRAIQKVSACHCKGPLRLSLRGSFPKQSVYYEYFVT